MWRSKRYWRGLIAKSLYEELSPREQAGLQRALDADSNLRHEAEALRRVVSVVPRTEIEGAPDLLPQLHAAIERGASASPVYQPIRFNRRVTAFAAAALLIGFGFGYWMLQPVNVAVQPQVSMTTPSLMQQAIVEARAMFVERQSGEAIRLLETAVRAQPNDPSAGEAYLLLADASFEEGQYELAEMAYRSLRDRHRDVLEASPEDRGRVADRSDLLAECRGDGFETLMAFDAAMRSDADRFDRLQEVAARAASDPHSILARQIVSAMAEPFVDAAGDRLAGLAGARDRCSNPLVAACINFEIGRRYEQELGDVSRAAEAYRLAGTHALYAEAATSALNQLSQP